MIRQDGHWVVHAGEILLPFRKGMYDHKEFMIIDVVIPFSGSKYFREICARV